MDIYLFTNRKFLDYYKMEALIPYDKPQDLSTTEISCFDGNCGDLKGTDEQHDNSTPRKSGGPIEDLMVSNIIPEI